MSIALSDEQLQFLAIARSALDKTLPAQRIVELAEGVGRDDIDDVWSTLVGIGATSLGDPATGSLLDLGLAVEAGGAALVPGALLAHGLAVRMVGHAAAGDADDWHQILVSGETRATAAAEATQGRLRLKRESGGWTANGTLRRVLEVPGCDVVVAWADVDASLGVVIVRLDDPGVLATAHPSFDPSRAWSDLQVNGVALSPPHVRLVTSRVGDAVDRDGAVLTGFDSLGSAQRALDTAVEYAKVREQFGRPIGAFQAIKHLLVDCHATVESMRSALLYAAWAVDETAEDVGFAVHAAKALAEAHRTVANAAVQVFGGIGFTRELPVHLHVKRAVLNERLFGTPDEHRRMLIPQLLQVTQWWSARPASSHADAATH